MKSTDHNLDNPMIVDRVDILKQISSIMAPPITFLRQEEYDLIHTKDSTRIYHIVDSDDGRSYLGDIIITCDTIGRMYLLGLGDKPGEYVIYLNEKDGINDKLIDLQIRYNNAQQAINDLHRFNRVGYHTDLSLQVYQLIVQYITKDLGINETILGIISLFGYKDDMRLQELMQVVMSYGVEYYQRDIPLYLRDNLGRIKNSNNYLFRFYSDLYDLIVLYNFFLGEEFQKNNPEDIELKEVIDKVYGIVLKTN
jgi:hypothetical protein